MFYQVAQNFRRQGLRSPSSHVFLRPHDVLIQTKPEETSAPARINRIVHLGWEVEVELSLKDGQEVKAYLTREQLDQLQLQSQQRVYVKPRKAKAFISCLIEEGSEKPRSLSVD